MIGKSRLRYWLCWVLMPALAGCASVPETAQTKNQTEIGAVIGVNPDQESIKTDSELALDTEIPKLDLDEELLADLLILNLASFKGDWGEAAQRAKKSAQKSQDFRLARLATLLALRNDDYKDGLVNAQLWNQLVADDVDAKNMLLITQLGAGDIEGAKVSVQSDLAEEELDEHIRQVAALLIRQKNKTSALEVSEFIVDEFSESAQAALSSAYVAEHFEDYDLAERWIKMALVIKPDWELAAQMKAKVLQSQGKIEERGEFIREYAAQNPDSIIMRLNVAAEMVREEELDQAHEYMQQVLEDAPRNVDALQYAAALSEDKKDFDEAARLYQRALNIEPNNDDVRWSLARRKLIDKQYAAAERHFSDITRKELIFSAQIQVANARFELYGLESAINTLSVLDPTTEREYVSLALTRHYMLMSEYLYEEALGSINEAMYYLPEHEDLIYARALVAAELKRLDIAEPDLRRIIERKPDHANALNALGYTLADQTDRLGEARELIERALELRPNDAHILDSMGWVAYKQNDLEVALDYLRKALDVSQEIEIATHLGEVLWESGDHDQAISIWREWYIKERDNRLLNETLERYEVDLNQSTNSGLVDS